MVPVFLTEAFTAFQAIYSRRSSYVMICCRVKRNRWVLFALIGPVNQTSNHVSCSWEASKSLASAKAVTLCAIFHDKKHLVWYGRICGKRLHRRRPSHPVQLPKPLHEHNKQGDQQTPSNISMQTTERPGNGQPMDFSPLWLSTMGNAHIMYNRGLQMMTGEPYGSRRARHNNKIIVNILGFSKVFTG